MKTAALWGCGDYGILAYKLLQEHAEDLYAVKYWCDSNPNKIGTKINEKIVISPDDLKKEYESQNIDIVIITVNFPGFNEVVLSLDKLGIEETYFIPQYWYTGRIYSEGQQFLYKVDIRKPMLEYYEYHVCDHCNLNCKGCGHVSNICDEYYADLDEYIRDLEQLKKLFSGCARIKLLGGEPLLNPELSKFIEITRQFFPESELYVGSNGLLIPKVDEELLDAMRKNSVFFMISLYPPVVKIKSRIEDRCREYGVISVFSPEIKEFNTRWYLDARFDCKTSHDECIKSMNGIHCFTLRGGKLSPCITFYIRMLKDKYDLDYKITEDDEFDLYKYTDGWELNKRLNQPIPFCAHCGAAKVFPWETVSKKDAALSDYIVE